MYIIMVLISLLGSDLIFMTESKECSSMEFSLMLCKLRLEYHKDQFQDLCYFLLYKNDFTQASEMFSMRLYADDTSLTVSGKKIDDLLYQINLELANMHDWLCANKLPLNLKQTKYVVFRPREKLNFNLLRPLILAGEILEKASNIKYLGIVIDHHLSWHDRIDYVCDKVSGSINIMTKVKRYLGKNCLISIYYSLVYSHLIYGCSLWGNNYDSPLSQLIRLQNKAVIYANCGLLKFCDIVKLYTCLIFL